jgi:RHS repeat-associated protein
LYRGEQYDSDLGLYYLRARYYNPNTGRFLSRDPYDGDANIPATLHKYLYAGGDPINRLDPTGRDMFETGLILDEISAANTAAVASVGYWVVKTLCYAVTALNVAIYIATGGKQFGPSGWPPDWKAFCGVLSLAGGPPKFPSGSY